MTIEEKVCRQEGIIAGLEIAISSVEGADAVDETKALFLARLQALLQTEMGALNTQKLKVGYDPTDLAAADAHRRKP